MPLDENAFTGQLGEDFISLVCTQSRTPYRATPRQDLGIDGQIEILDSDYRTTGQLILVQSKAGTSYVTDTGRYLVKADKEHFEAWAKYTIPIVGIVYNPDALDARWVNISEHLRDHPECVSDGPFQIEALKEQVFSVDGFPGFRSSIEQFYAGLTRPRMEDVLDRYFTSETRDDRVRALWELFAYYRWTLAGCFTFHQLITQGNAITELGMLVDFISYYRSHPDRYYTQASLMPEQKSAQLQKIADQCLKEFDGLEVAKMLSVIDSDNGLNRGSLGQTVWILLSLIPHITDKLVDIIEDKSTDPSIRGWAIQLLRLERGRDLRFFKSLVPGEQDSFVQESLSWAIETFSWE